MWSLAAMKLVLFLIIIVLVVNTIVATIMGKKKDLRAAKQAAKAKLSPKPKDQQARDRARAAQRASKPPPVVYNLLRANGRALERAENLAQQLAQALPTSSVATPAITPTAAAATAPPSITSPWQSGNMVECDFPGDKTCTVIIQSIGISTTNSAEVWLEDPVDPFAGESFTVLLSALRPVGGVVDPEYEALMASKLIESNRNRFVEEPSGQCGAASVGRQASDNRSASDAQHVRFARELAANAIENQFDLMTDVCGTADDLTQRIRMHRRVSGEASCSPENYLDDNDLIALAAYTQRSIYIVSYGSCWVRVISGAAVSALPDVQHLSEISFPIDAIVVEFIGSHYNSFPLNATFEPTVVPPDPATNTTNETSINAASTSPFPSFPCAHVDDACWGASMLL